MPFAPADLSEDFFLGGRLAILQPRRGYRAATDPVLLAAAVPAREGDSVLELGCGAGVASLCLAKRRAGLVQTGIELQPDYAALAVENAARNGLALSVVPGDITDLPEVLRGAAFDHVIANPPYFASDTPAAADPGRALALREDTPLGHWVTAGLRRLRPGGRLTMIHRAERLPGILQALEGRASAVVLPLSARVGREAGRVIVAARKGGRSPFRLLAPLVMHAGAEHGEDRDDFTAQARAILRDGAELPLGF